MSEHKHDFPDWPFPSPINTAAFCTGKVVRERFPVLQVSHDTNGDWQFLDATTDEPGECVLLCLGCVFERDPTLAQISDLPLGWSAFRPAVGSEWARWEKVSDNESEEEGTHSCNSADGEEKAIADIAEFGLHIISVQADANLPPFSYSIGIEKSLGLPELIVIGLKAEVAQAAINECYRQMKSGVAIVPGAYVHDLLGGDFKCLIGVVTPESQKEYMGWAFWLHQGGAFRTYRIIYPNTAGVFPGEAEATEWFKGWQPLLAGPSKLGAN